MKIKLFFATLLTVSFMSFTIINSSNPKDNSTEKTTSTTTEDYDCPCPGGTYTAQIIDVTNTNPGTVVVTTNTANCENFSVAYSQGFGTGSGLVEAQNYNPDRIRVFNYNSVPGHATATVRILRNGAVIGVVTVPKNSFVDLAAGSFHGCDEPVGNPKG